MAVKLPLYPLINQKIAIDMGWKAAEFKVYYETKDHKQRALEIKASESDSKLFYLEDPMQEWNPDEYGFYVKSSLSIKNPSVLFGKKGVANENAVIGVGCQWYSKESRQRGSFRLLSIRENDSRLSAAVPLWFDPGKIRGDLHIGFVFFIEEADVSPKHLFLANQPGVLLGGPEIPALDLRFDGIGSLFPIVSDELENGLLWSLFCEWEEPEFEMFDECVRITLNKNHPMYPQVDTNNKKFNPALLIEIVSSAMCQVIMKFKEDNESWERMIQEENLYEGSISQAVAYFSTVLGWNYSSLNALSDSIRHYLEGSLYGIKS